MSPPLDQNNHLISALKHEIKQAENNTVSDEAFNH